jgi:uroporphyrinogen decarboxylase
MALFAGPEFVIKRIRALLNINHGRPGYIVNLGHGINKETPIESVAAMIDTVKANGLIA